VPLRSPRAVRTRVRKAHKRVQTQAGRHGDVLAREPGRCSSTCALLPHVASKEDVQRRSPHSARSRCRMASATTLSKLQIDRETHWQSAPRGAAVQQQRRATENMSFTTATTSPSHEPPAAAVALRAQTAHCRNRATPLHEDARQDTTAATAELCCASGHRHMPRRSRTRRSRRPALPRSCPT